MKLNLLKKVGSGVLVCGMIVSYLGVTSFANEVRWPSVTQSFSNKGEKSSGLYAGYGTNGDFKTTNSAGTFTCSLKTGSGGIRATHTGNKITKNIFIPSSTKFHIVYNGKTTNAKTTANVDLSVVR